jgi:hypothetical protein
MRASKAVYAVSISRTVRITAIHVSAVSLLLVSAMPPPICSLVTIPQSCLSPSTGLSASVSRLETQLGKLQLDKWAQAALVQLARTNLLMGLAAGGSKSSSSKQGTLT